MEVLPISTDRNVLLTRAEVERLCRLGRSTFYQIALKHVSGSVESLYSCRVSATKRIQRLSQLAPPLERPNDKKKSLALFAGFIDLA